MSLRMRTKVRRLFTILGVKTLAATVIAALAFGALAWAVLPISPRLSIQSKHTGIFASCTPDCRFVAVASGQRSSPRTFEGELSVWDTRESRELFSIPYKQIYPPVANGGYSFAFTPEADKLVLYSWGEANYHLLPTGEEWRPE